MLKRFTVAGIIFFAIITLCSHLLTFISFYRRLPGKPSDARKGVLTASSSFEHKVLWAIENAKSGFYDRAFLVV